MSSSTPFPGGDCLLHVEDVCQRFGGLQALDHVSFGVRAGEIKAVIGPNGAGKTTLFNVVSGIVRPQAGSVRLAGRLISGLAPHRIAALGLSRTFQNPSLFLNMSTLENVMVGRHARTHSGLLSAALRLPGQRREESATRKTALDLLEMVGLPGAAERPVGALSFGQRRMVELARALATEPKVLLLDEPASGLNARETEDLAGLIGRIRARGVTILLVEHDMSLVMDIAQSIVVLHFGVPIADGTPAEIRGDPRVVSVYLGGDFTDAAGA